MGLLTEALCQKRKAPMQLIPAILGILNQHHPAPQAPSGDHTASIHSIGLVVVGIGVEPTWTLQLGLHLTPYTQIRFIIRQLTNPGTDRLRVARVRRRHSPST
jgi:hypothetical protein